jgi:Tfp pilus assembly protein PilO
MNNPLQKLTRLIDLAGAAACAALVAAMIFGALLPLLRHRNDAQTARQELLKEHRRVETAKAAVTAIQAQIAGAQTALRGHPVRLEDVRSINRRLARINALAAGRGLDVQGVEPGAVVRGMRYQTIDVKLTGGGGYEGCARFLRDLHDAFPDTAVIALKLYGSPQEVDAPLSFDLQLRWYAAPSHATAAAQ